MKFALTAFFALFAVVGLASAQCAPGPTTPNDATLSLIKQFEGFEPTPKPNPIGLPTVGYGHRCRTQGCSEVRYPFPLSEADATQLLANDLRPSINCLHTYISKSVALNDNQFGALTSFVFNAGCGTIRSSNLLKRFNGGEDPNTVASEELPRYNRSGGKVLPELVRRRAAEVDLFRTPSSTIAHPLC